MIVYAISLDVETAMAGEYLARLRAHASRVLQTTG